MYLVEQFLFFDKCTIAISLALALTNGGSWQIVICSSGTKRKWCCWWPTPKLRQNAINVSINPGPIFHVFYQQSRASFVLKWIFWLRNIWWERKPEEINHRPPRQEEPNWICCCFLSPRYRARSWKRSPRSFVDPFSSITFKLLHYQSITNGVLDTLDLNKNKE